MGQNRLVGPATEYIAAEFRAEVARRQWTLDDVARETGVARSTVQRYLKGQSAISVELLRPLVEATARGALVFTSPEGSRVQSQHFAYRVWRPALERAGLDHLRVHDLRHTHASWLIAAGVPLPVIQRRLGHESISTTVDVYGHLAPDAHAGAAEAADLAMASALPQIEG